jgi:hypothetical protein
MTFWIFQNPTYWQVLTIELILGGAVWSRIGKKIRCKQCSETNDFTCCNEHIKHSKINKIESKPFDDEIHNKIIEIISSNNLMPREINKHIMKELTLFACVFLGVGY